MTFTEQVLLAGLVVNTIGLAIVLFKVVWGRAESHTNQLGLLERACNDGISACRNEFWAKMESQSSNLGNVTANLGNRIHDVELKAMEARAIAAETFMRRDSYHKATDEFKRDVKDAHDDLRAQMNTGFAELKEQIGAVSMSIEENRRASHQH